MHRLTWVALEPYRAGRIEDNAPWGPLHVPVTRQGFGRFDNPRRYAALYAATSRVAAYAEVFADDRRGVTPSTFSHPREPDVVRCLVTYEVETWSSLCDLDDPAVLVEYGIRPSQVVRRDRETTQDVALNLWLRRASSGHTGLTWWSFHNPAWTVCMLWSDGHDDGRPVFDALRVVDLQPAGLDDPDLVVAAHRCRFELRPSG